MTSALPTIAIDLDEVLTVSLPHMASWHNAKYGTSFHYDDAGFANYLFHQASGDSDADGFAKVLEWFSSEGPSAAVIPGAQEAMEALKQRYNLVIVTSRPTHLAPLTHTWVETHFPGVFSETYFGNHRGEGAEISKVDLCRQAGATLLIDDQPRYIREMSAAGIPAILFGNYVWNSHCEPLPGVQKAADWNEVVSLLIPE
jgi:5'(3')-deoxyribonucleotidase